MAIKKIGTAGTGRDYSTLQAWEDALPATLTEHEVAELYADSEFFSSGRLLQLSGVTSGSYTITVRPAVGHSFRDHANKLTNRLAYDPANGVALRSSAQYSPGIYTENVDNIIFDGLQIKGTGTGNAHGISTGSNTTIKNCIFHSSSSGVTIEAGGTGTLIVNTLAINAGTGGGIGTKFGAKVINCTVVNSRSTPSPSPPFRSAYGSSTVKNCASFGFNSASAGSFDADGHNVTDYSSVPGTVANLVNVPYFDQFLNNSVAAGLEDFRLKSISALRDAGVRDAAYTNDLDIFGLPRSLTTPTVGCFEYRVIDGPPAAVSTPMTIQPQGRARINPANPLAKGLIRAYNFANQGRDVVCGGAAWGLTNVRTFMGGPKGKGFYHAPGIGGSGKSVLAADGFTGELEGKSEMTFSVYYQNISSAGAAASDFIFGAVADGGSYDWGLYLGSEATVFFRASGGLVSPSLGALVENSTRMYTCRYNGSKVQVFIDGKEVASANVSGTISTIVQTMSSYAWNGGNNATTGNLLLGTIHNRALSDAEIKQQANNPWQIFLDVDNDYDVLATIESNIRHALTAGSMSQSNTSSTGSVNQSQRIAVSSAQQTNNGSTGNVTQRHVLQGSGAVQNNAGGAGQVSQHHRLVGANAQQLNTASVGALNQVRHLLAGLGSKQDNHSVTGSIAQRHVLSSAATEQLNKSAGIIVAQHHRLVAAGCGQQNLASAGAVNVRHMLVLGHCFQTNTSNQEAGWVFVPSAARTIHVTPNGFEGGEFWDFTDPFKPKFIKEPLNAFDISFDWTQYLEEIQAGLSSHQLILPPGLVNDLDVREGALCTIFISEGVGPSFVTCRVQIDSTPPRSEDRTVWFNIADI